MWIGADGGSVKVSDIERFGRVSLALEDGRLPVVAEGAAEARRGPFPPDGHGGIRHEVRVVTAPHRPGGTRVLLEVPVRRGLLAGTAQ
ncbi:pyridoxamine 5'-phosphate oxidase [Streptomyces sp. TG1A-60]|uniref:pyridoxamine 5'-phosphate oxidase n=1 Tax=Streptomyces sp. TG1A-60 TaxID=3129111 RepID=UPI0030D16F0A